MTLRQQWLNLVWGYAAPLIDNLEAAWGGEIRWARD